MSGKTISKSTARQQAFELLNSLRGKYIISQALHYGIRELDKLPVPYREVSNLNDMQYLREVLFNFPVDTNDNAIAKAKEESLIE